MPILIKNQMPIIGQKVFTVPDKSIASGMKYKQIMKAVFTFIVALACLEMLFSLKYPFTFFLSSVTNSGLSWVLNLTAGVLISDFLL